MHTTKLPVLFLVCVLATVHGAASSANQEVVAPVRAAAPATLPAAAAAAAAAAAKPVAANYAPKTDLHASALQASKFVQENCVHILSGLYTPLNLQEAKFSVLRTHLDNVYAYMTAKSAGKTRNAKLHSRADQDQASINTFRRSCEFKTRKAKAP